MKLTFALTSAAALLAVAGCVPYHYTDAPAVSGRVLDARSHRPIAAASISVEPRTAAEPPTARTASDGRFSLVAEQRWALFAPGQMRQATPSLLVQAPGYRPARVPLRLQEQPLRLEQPVELQPAP